MATPQDPTNLIETSARKRAVIYLRVSTARQAETDVDPEGYSIPSQRTACERRAESLDADIVDEYVDRGESRTPDPEGWNVLAGKVKPALLTVLYVISCGAPRGSPNRASRGRWDLGVATTFLRIRSKTVVERIGHFADPQLSSA